MLLYGLQNTVELFCCLPVIIYRVKMRKVESINFRFGGRSTTFCSSADEADVSLENPLEGKIKFDGNRYEISSPFKEGHPNIPDNYNVARSSLESLTNRLKAKPDVLRRYDDVIKEQLEAGVVENVEYSEQLSNTPGSKFCRFNIRKWTANSEELLQRIENAENAQNVTTNSQNTEISELCEDDESFAKSTCNAICSEDEVKVLGIAWDRKNDKFKFNFSNFAQAAASSEPVTKRIILSTTARFYDPLGWLSPVIVPLKEIFQKVCELKIDWDDELPTEISNEWHKLINDIANISSIEFQRSLLGDFDVKDIRFNQ